MNKKILVIILVTVFVSLIGYAIWYRSNVGTLEVKAPQYGVSFRLDDNKEIYTNSMIFKKLSAGTHIVSAFETGEGLYYEKEFEIIVERGQTSFLKILLERKETNPDVSGEEYGF